MRRPPRVEFLACFAAALALLVATPALATDYDIRSAEWNGLGELVRIAREADVDLRAVTTLEWGDVRRGDGLLVLYPLSSIDLHDVSGFLEDGGRLGVFDDFGTAGPGIEVSTNGSSEPVTLLQWFQVRRETLVTGRARSQSVPGLLVAGRRYEHPLSDNVEELVTNEPVALFHARLTPVFTLDDEQSQGIVLAGVVGRGRLVLSGDPSVLINTMMRFPGNRQFAHNLLAYLAGRPGGRVFLVHGDFRTHGLYRGRHAQEPLRRLVVNFNDMLDRISSVGRNADAVRWFTIAFGVAALSLLARRIWGQQPSHRFGPTGPSGAVASLGDKMYLFGLRRANLLYPTLVAKRYFERAVLRAVGLRAPTDIGAVLRQAGPRLGEASRNDLRALLKELDSLSTPAHEGGPSRVSPQRFLSLWRRIGAILDAIQR